MQKRWVVGFVLGIVVTAAVVVGGGAPAGAEAPTRVGGQLVAPHAGNTYPSASSNGAQTLVVYQLRLPDRYEIYGRLLSPDTATMGPPILIGGNGKTHGRPDVAWNGSEWLVVYQEKLVEIDYDVVGQRVSSSGATVGAPFRIGYSGGKELSPAVAAGPNGQWAVAWESTFDEGATGRDVMVGRVSAAGVPLDPLQGKRASWDTAADRSSDVTPDIAYGGGRYVVVWEATGAKDRIDIAEFRPGGGIRHQSWLRREDRQFPVGSPAIASDGSRFLVVYEDNFSGNDVEIAAAEVSYHPNGQGWGWSGGFISRQAGHEQEPAVAWNGSYLITWRDRRRTSYGDLYGARVKAGFQVLDPNGFLISDYHRTNANPAVTRGASPHRFAVAWQETPADNPNPGIAAVGLNFAAPK